MDRWKREYYNLCPHGSLGGLLPAPETPACRGFQLAEYASPRLMPELAQELS